MAGAGKKTFQVNEVLSAADVNQYLMDQAVMRFADATARSSAIGTPTEGMVSYLQDSDSLSKFDGTNWVDVVSKVTVQEEEGFFVRNIYITDSATPVGGNDGDIWLVWE